jgi:hypothetical protein
LSKQREIPQFPYVAIMYHPVERTAMRVEITYPPKEGTIIVPGKVPQFFCVSMPPHEWYDFCNYVQAQGYSNPLDQLLPEEEMAELGKDWQGDYGRRRAAVAKSQETEKELRSLVTAMIGEPKPGRNDLADAMTYLDCLIGGVFQTGLTDLQEILMENRPEALLDAHSKSNSEWQSMVKEDKDKSEQTLIVRYWKGRAAVAWARYTESRDQLTNDRHARWQRLGMVNG